MLLEDGRPSFSLIHFWPGNSIRVKAREPLPVNQFVHLAVTYDGSAGGLGPEPLPDSVFSKEPDGGPTPSVSAGTDPTEPPSTDTGGGCSSAPGGQALALPLLALVLLALRRRVSNDLDGRSAS